MHNRFTRKRTDGNGVLAFILPVCIFAAIFVLFMNGIGSISTMNTDKEKESLEEAISRDIVYCYAETGRYPESLEYIKKNCGLTYDSTEFYIDYRPVAANILPEVTVIDMRKGASGR